MRNLISRKSDTKYLLFLGMIAVVFFIIWRWIAVKAGITGYLTVDDIASVQFALMGDSIPDKLKNIIIHEPTNVPIFYLLTYFWTELFGFSANIMRLLPQILGALFIIVTGRIGEKIYNKRVGIISAILVGSSLQLVYASYQVRAYSLMMLFSAIVYYAWLCRDERKYSIIKYALAMIVLCYSHFFGILICAAFCSFDLLNVILKKEKSKIMTSYVILGCCFIPYLILAFLNVKNVWGNFWPPVPGFRDFFEMIWMLCPTAEITIYLFGSAFFVYLFIFIDKIKNKEFLTKLYEEDAIFKKELFVCFWNVFAVIIVVFLYSKYLNPTSSIWVYRYFLVLYPFVIAIIAWTLEMIFVWFEDKCNINKFVLLGCALFIGITYTYVNCCYQLDNWQEVTYGGVDFQKVTDYVMSRKDINEESTLVYFEYPEKYFEGWEKYASKDGELELPNLCCTKKEFFELDLTQYEKIYVIRAVYTFAEESSGYLMQTHQLMEQNCDGVEYVDCYIKQ